MQFHPPTSPLEVRIASPTDAETQAGSGTGGALPSPQPDLPRGSEPGFSHKLRSRLLWAAAIVAAILLLTFVPPLINANRYQRQIAHSIGASLGRPVHLDNASLHLLPVPGLTLSNFVVSEDPAFGAEPTIRANTVEATLRLGSLWRRPVEFSTVRFVEPSVNLVRNAQGRWNFADVLLHASHVQTAPTAQMHAGPAPRFPYIEATGGRLNIKFGDEKLPFSLTDTEFALWLPSPNQWKVRLKGQPARTDTDLNDPGTLRIEAELQRAETTNGIPVDMHATWHDAPLGEASRLLNGDDMGWRGTLNVDATVTGTLNAAQFGAKFTFGGVRRAEFAAAQPLDLQITCGAGLVAAVATVHGLRCTMPDSAPTPMLLSSDTIDLAHPQLAQTVLTANDIPLHWGMLWAALFSPRVPTNLQPEGRISIHLEHGPGFVPASVRVVPAPSRRHRSGRRQHEDLAGTPESLSGFPWSGEVRVELPSAPPPRAGASATSFEAALPKSAEAPGGPVLVWRPVPPEMLPAVRGPGGYTVLAKGTASATDLLLPARYLPQLGDGLENVLPEPSATAEPARLDFACVHPWGASQSCAALRATVSSSRSGARLPLGLGATQLMEPQPQVQLGPRSLSPLDYDPQLGGMPSPAPQTSPERTPGKALTKPKSLFPPILPVPHP